MLGKMGVWGIGAAILLLAAPGQALACGCCYQQFNPWPMYHHTMYESPGGQDCPGGFPRTIEPHGAHGNLLPDSCSNGTYHNQCGVTLRHSSESLLFGSSETLKELALRDPEIRFGNGGVEFLTCQGEVYGWAPLQDPEAPFRKLSLVVGSTGA
jgi:hypothetical protein